MTWRLFIGQKFRKKITPTPALYPSSKNTDSVGLFVAVSDMKRAASLVLNIGRGNEIFPLPTSTNAAELVSGQKEFH